MNRTGTVAFAALLALTAPVAAYAAPTPDDPLDRFERTESGPISSDVVPASADGAAKVTVMVEMTAEPVAVVEANRGQLTKAEKQALKADRKAAQDKLTPAIKKLGGSVRSQVQSAYNGVKVSIARKDAAKLADLPGVKAVHDVQKYEPSNATTIPYLGVDQVWQDTGYTGDGIKVAIIDTGIDYTHATFGGPGTPEAFAEAASTSDQAADEDLFGPYAPRVKGGRDFVGDEYDANDPTSVPMPDSNPLDCYGHGTHVAGTAGGGGVTADGYAYTGPYDSTTSDTDFLVGPGVAPEFDLYALRVFGCGGSTDVTVEAIDWAVANDMDVINMSLGSTYGTNDDPTSVAATNAAADGIVVVASAGNEGPNPYLTGSPGSADGVISVAAMDATEAFPGVEISVEGGATVEALNANGAALPSDPLTIVRLTDDPNTAENESLGCSVEAFLNAHVFEGGNQLAVASRGTCARVAKAIFGQQAGAAAVVMVNSADSLPPYEGPITENPDDGTPYTVTIPFLGVRSSDGPDLVDGETATLADADIANPGFEGYADFSSGGPRTGDSALKPTISAPGVSIASAGIGTGNGPMINSGTSMAAPHVAGVAALAVEAHPGWTGQDVSAALVSTADPTQLADYRLTLGGGLVDTAAVVDTDTFAYGDEVAEGFREATLSFGFAELGADFEATKTVTLANDGTTAQTFGVTYEATEESIPADVTLSTDSVTVPEGGSATVDVTLTVEATDVPSTGAGDGQHGFQEASGNIVLTSTDRTHRVGYLLVPRPATALDATVAGSLKAPNTTADLRFTNEGAVAAGDVDIYTWGLEDAQDQTVQAGFDLQAAGVQSFPAGEDNLLVFALSTHDRFSNAASIEFDVLLDTNRDKKNDIALFSYDSGAVRTGSADGLAEVFIYDLHTGALSSSGFLAVAPTDSSTVLLPVLASDLGLRGRFRYSAASFYGDADWDQFSSSADYDATRKALTDGGYDTVGANETVDLEVALNRGAFSSMKPLGFMAVAYDNPAGTEALLVPVK